MAPPRDQFERYFAEKLWAWVPEVYREADRDTGVLRALIEALAPSIAAARRSVDRLWEDQFAEFADDWALPYLGELVGTRLVNALNRRGRRVDVARTIYYRRRKGTLPLLETLARDITGWDAVVVEAMRRLARTPHGLDAPLAGAGRAASGRVSGTPPGGAADLRNPRGAALADGPWDEFAHTPDVRPLRGHLGRWNIAKLNFHLFRHVAYGLRGVTPFDLGGQRYLLDPSGRDRALYRAPQQAAVECERRLAWQITAPLDCRLLAEAQYRLTRAQLPAPVAAALAPLVDQRVQSTARLRQSLAALLTPVEFDTHVFALLAAGITPDSPRARLIPDAVAVTLDASVAAAPVPQERLLPANLEDWGVSLAGNGHACALDPQRGRLLVFNPLGVARVFLPGHFIGAVGPIGAATYSRAGSVQTSGVATVPDGGPTQPGPVTGFALAATGMQQFGSSKTYEPVPPAGNNVAGVQQLTLQAADRERPYVRLVPGGGGSAWTFTADPKPPGADPELPANRRVLVLDGLWLGLRPGTLSAQAVAGAEVAATPVEATLVIDGVFDLVLIRHCTLDPGGEQARLVPTQVTPVPVLRLEIVGEVEELRIERSIVGPVREFTTGADACSASRIVITDSIVQSIVPGRPAIETRVAAVQIERSTVFGDVRVNRLDASETLIQGLVQVTDNQHGCLRFSAVDDRPAARLPRQFESHLFAPALPNHFFVSRRFGDAGYAQLSPTAAPAVAAGAENRSEMGAYSRLLAPIRQQDLAAKVAELMPFGLIAQFIFET